MVTPVLTNRRRRQRPGWSIILLLIILTFAVQCHADEDEDFLAEILAEEAKHEAEHAEMEAELREMEAMRAQQNQNFYQNNMRGGGKPKMGRGRGKGNMPGSNFSKLEEELKKKETQQSETQKAQQAIAEEEAAAKKAEQIRLKREADYEASLKKMNEEERKRAQKQKAMDAKVVSRILKHASKGNHYAVLGIRNFEFQFGPYYILNWSIGPFTLFHTQTKEIKRMYRNLARTVHPDKNKDGRAEEAFHAIETSAAILTDDKKRKEYDQRLISARRRRNKEVVERVADVTGRIWNGSAGAITTAKKVLGPFSTPILVVGALII